MAVYTVSIPKRLNPAIIFILIHIPLAEYHATGQRNLARFLARTVAGDAETRWHRKTQVRVPLRFLTDECKGGPKKEKATMQDTIQSRVPERIYSILVLTFLGLSWNGTAQAMDNQSEAVRIAIGILDDPTWHERDPWIQKYREEDRKQQTAAPERTQSAIATREFTAMQAIIEGYVPPSGLPSVLTTYVNHRNEQVAVSAVSELMRRGAWSLDRGIEFATPKRSIALWLSLLETALTSSEPLQARLRVARAAVRARFELANNVDQMTLVQLARAAARLLVQSREAEDAQLVARIAEMHPEEIILWLAVSRLSVPPATKNVAGQIARDTSKPQPLRIAASIAEKGNDDPDTIRNALSEIHSYLQEFGSESFASWLKEGHGHTPDPTNAAKMKRMIEGQAYFAILRELTPNTVRSEMSRILDEAPGLRGMLLPIMARRASESVLDWITATPSRSSDEYRAAFLIAQLKPELSDRARPLVPQSDWNRLDAELRQYGLEFIVGVAATLTLWEE